LGYTWTDAASVGAIIQRGVTKVASAQQVGRSLDQVTAWASGVANESFHQSKNTVTESLWIIYCFN
jgi:hypothetical protein